METYSPNLIRNHNWRHWANTYSRAICYKFTILSNMLGLMQEPRSNCWGKWRSSCVRTTRIWSLIYSPTYTGRRVCYISSRGLLDKPSLKYKEQSRLYRPWSNPLVSKSPAYSKLLQTCTLKQKATLRLKNFSKMPNTFLI